MNATIPVEPVRKRVWVCTTPVKAFEIFTGGMTSWWPRHHSINSSAIREVIVEPVVGGRWFERGENGSECQWGTVLVWAPPDRLVLSWQINARWQFDPALITQVEVSFCPEENGTLVELVHRLEGYGPAAEQMRQVFDGPQAWAATLERFVQGAEHRTQPGCVDSEGAFGTESTTSERLL